MVGDGINDALAMAEADLSFAVGSGTDVANRVGHIVLLRGIEGIRDFFEIKERTMRRKWLNLFWAFFYNAIGIPIAGGLLYNKGIYLRPKDRSASAMAGASLIPSPTIPTFNPLPFNSLI